jgi:hypothetical protein
MEESEMNKKLITGVLWAYWPNRASDYAFLCLDGGRH